MNALNIGLLRNHFTQVQNQMENEYQEYWINPTADYRTDHILTIKEFIDMVDGGWEMPGWVKVRVIRAKYETGPEPVEERPAGINAAYPCKHCDEIDLVGFPPHKCKKDEK
jgi:hypothetical protein